MRSATFPHSAPCGVFADGNGENATKDGKQAGPMKDGTMLAVYFGTGYSPKGPGSGKVRKTPRWPRSWADFSLL